MSKHQEASQLMAAVQYEGHPFHVSVNQIPIPNIQEPHDCIIRLTSAGICGTELHMFHGRLLGINPPLTFGHEIIGIITDVGSGVTNLKVGDRVIAYDGVSCGFCDNCVKGLRAYCETVNKPFEGEYFGIPSQGIQLNGGQAQFVRVPYAEQGTLLLPPGTDHELDYLLLCDVWPTAWAGLDFAGFQPGDTVAVFGAGPVGLLCAYSAILRGASRVYSIDRVSSRLEKARSIGAIPINFSKSDPVKQIIALEPLGVDRACDLVGYECVDAAGVNVPSEVITNCINVTKPGGGIGIIGVYNPEDPGAPTADTKKGILSIPFATLYGKGLSMKTGAVAPNQYYAQLRALIESGKANLNFVWGKEIEISQALQTYREFSAREILKPVIRFAWA